MKTMATLAGALLTATLAAAPAAAAIVTATYTGHVSYGYDYTGAFDVQGMLNGASMVSSFVYDTNVGHRHTSGSDDYVEGGTNVGGASPLLSASVTIGGVTQALGVPNFYSLAEVNGGNLAQEVANEEFSDSFLELTLNFFTYYHSYVYAAAPIPRSLGTSFTVMATGDSLGNQYAEILNSYAVTGGSSGISQEAIASGTVDSLTVVATGVPEPATWALLIAGFGAVGVAARRHRPVAA